VQGLCGTDRVADVEQFFAAHPVPAAERLVRQAVDRLTQCSRLKEGQGQNLERWLRQNTQ
jgi:aminopeptidase N/puromycin-sensitive aminopeptidase